MIKNLHDLVARQTSSRGDNPAVTYRDETLSYADLWGLVQSFAAGLQRIGVSRGERVAVYLEKRVETVVAILGASAAGAVFVPINPLLRPKQVGYILADCDVRVLVTSPERLDSLSMSEGPGRPDEVVLVGDVTSDPATSMTSWDELLDTSASEREDRSTTDYDVAAILYTSGSTGQPKGVVLSHRNLLVGAESVSGYLGNHEDDVILAALPLSFDAGFSQLTTAFFVGAHVVLMNYLWPADVVKLCAKHQVTGLTCVPPLWIQLTSQEWPDSARVSLRYFANTGGRMPRTTLDRLRALFPDALPYLMYGLTEAFRSTYLDPAEVDRRPDSIGKAIPNAEILVVAADGSLCGPGEEGELVHRGPLVSLGYWNDPERTSERFKPSPIQPDGVPFPELAVWSGDTVVRDEEGFLYFVGRSDEMIKTSGYRVSPTEVEEAAYDTGLVKEAAAMGVPDDTLGQAIVLFASPGTNEPDWEEALIGAMRKSVPQYMVPRQLIARDALPRSANGKIDRKLLHGELE